MLLKAEELAETHGWFLSRQFENEANANVHSDTTAQEILSDFSDERLDYWVTGFGTGGKVNAVEALGIVRPAVRVDAVCNRRSRQRRTKRSQQHDDHCIEQLLH